VGVWSRVKAAIARMLPISPALAGPSASWRSSSWIHARAMQLRRVSHCEACGHTEDLEVHHVEPFSRAPFRETDLTNLMTLGEKCPTGNHHLLFGHLGDWSCSNPNVREDAAFWFKKITGRRRHADEPASFVAAAPSRKKNG